MRDIAPAIVQAPASQIAGLAQPATFVVLASGTAPLSYQWLRNDAEIAGATGPSYTLTSATLADSGARFRVRVSNVHGEVMTEAVTLTVVASLPKPHARGATSVPTGRVARPRR